MGQSEEHSKEVELYNPRFVKQNKMRYKGFREVKQKVNVKESA